MLQKSQIIPKLLLLLFLLTGIVVYSDYGIAWDENFQLHDNGHAVWNYVSHNDFDSYEKNPEKYHGPAFELILVAAEKITGISDSRGIFLQRHLLSFLFYWLSGLALYMLLIKRFSNPLVITLGICWYFLMPRIFADSFYNTKDVPFLAMTTICLYSLHQILETNKLKWAVCHGIFCGFMISIRIMGIIIPAITIFAMLFNLIVFKTDKVKTFYSIILFSITSLLTTIIFWPILWQHPFDHLFAAWQEMSKYPWASTVMYRGVFMDTLHLPWHYALTWIGITTPLMYLTFLIISFWLLLKKIASVFKEKSMLFYYMLVSLIAAPLLSVVVLNSIMYDGWRHLFFIYAPMIVLIVYGFDALLKFFMKHNKTFWLVIPAIVLTIYTGYWMIDAHPYQNIFFNKLIGKNAGAAMNKYELDYWGISYREALEKIATKDSSEKIKVYVSNAPGIMNSWILEEKMRNRFEFVSSNDSADYFITNYRWEIIEDRDMPPVDSIVVDGARISGTYRVALKAP